MCGPVVVCKARYKRLTNKINKQGGVCFYCGDAMNRTMNHPKAASMDHKIPRSCGGNKIEDNIVACCRTCNSLKGSQSAEEFMRKIR